jgi:hypothetical protein
MQELGDLFKSMVFDKIVKKMIQSLFAKIPFLGWGPIGTIVSMLLTKLANALYEALAMYIDFQIIAFKNKKLEEQFTTASVELYSAANQYGIDSAEFEMARKANDDAFFKFIEMGDTPA